MNDFSRKKIIILINVFFFFLIFSFMHFTSKQRRVNVVNQSLGFGM